MIAGTIILEDTTINFRANDKNEVSAIISDTYKNISEEILVPQESFFKALAIAVHSDGTPDHNVDYADAESIMRLIRWIP